MLEVVADIPGGMTGSIQEVKTLGFIDGTSSFNLQPRGILRSD